MDSNTPLHQQHAQKIVEELEAGTGIPEGNAFWDLLWQTSAKCEATTTSIRSELGEKAPECFSNLGTVLSLLYRLATCAWGCSQGDHVIESIVGRATSSAIASMRLMTFGYYDESLSLTRNIAEIANLLSLFVADSTTFDDWKHLSADERQKKYGPFKVRIALEQRKKHIPFIREHYSLFCEIAVHITPDTKTQFFNPVAPTLGDIFQPLGYIMALNELAQTTAWVALLAPKLTGVDQTRIEVMRTSAITLLSSVGGVKLGDTLRIEKNENSDGE